MTKAMRLPLAIAATGGLAACIGTGAVIPGYTGTSDPSMLRYAAGKGDMFTEVVGNPFNAPKEEVVRAATGTMYRAHFGPPIHFKTERDADNTSPYRVVLLFNPGRNVTPIKLCEYSRQPTQPVSSKLRVMLAFCSSGYRETSVTGRVDGVTAPNDASFQALIRQMTGQLLPPRNPNLNGGPDLDFDS